MDWKKAFLSAGAAGAALLAARALLRRSYDFRDKVVLITGGSRGLGLVLARQLADAGARLALCSRDADELEAARRELADRGADVSATVCDVAERESVMRMVAEVRSRFGRIDVLINNAGTIAVGPYDLMTAADYESAMRNNFFGAVNCTLAVLPDMRSLGGGRIVNISSFGGKVAAPHLLPYTAAKFALTGFSEGLRAEAAKDGIVVTTICPGLMRTGSPPNAEFKGRHREEYAWFSTADSLPVLSMSAEAAARRILRACRRGEAEVVLTLPAKLAALFHGLFPGWTSDLAGLVNRYLLPASGGIGTGSRPGRESQSEATPSALTAATGEAARQNNEVPAAAR